MLSNGTDIVEAFDDDIKYKYVVVDGMLHSIYANPKW